MPLDTCSLTAELRLTCVPAAGFEAITLPAGTTSLDAVLTEPVVRPAVVNAEEAAAWVSPTTFGTATVTGWPFTPPTPVILTCCRTTDGARFIVLSLKFAAAVKYPVV